MAATRGAADQRLRYAHVPSGLAVSVVTRQGDVFFVTAGPGETTSVLPMGSAYEGTLFVLFEIMVLKLKALLDGVD